MHNRAEHCIGTAFLCSQLIEILERNSQRKIDELLRKCVILGGLLHDLGHGPFSHLWEGVVHQGSDTQWTHEVQSQETIEHLIKSNGIKLDESPERHEFALRLITSLITGDCETWAELLEPEDYFITEIVSNKLCNIDVDKCDYILRDQHYVSDHVTLKPFADFLQRARIVFDSDGISHIAYHCDDFELIENLFYDRAYLHMNVYQNHQVAACEKMVKDICVKAAAGGVKIANLPLTEVHQDQSGFLQLDDSVLEVIEESEIENPLVKESQSILKNLNDGRHYQLVWESNDDAKTIFDALVKKFDDIFCIVPKRIPSAEVPTNIPIYGNDGKLMEMKSSLRLSFESTMIFCVKLEEVKNVKNFIDSLNNNI